LPHKDFSIPARPFDSIFDSKAKTLVGMTDDEVAYIEAKGWKASARMPPSQQTNRRRASSRTIRRAGGQSQYSALLELEPRLATTDTDIRWWLPSEAYCSLRPERK
jgi:hypothetical protein